MLYCRYLMVAPKVKCFHEKHTRFVDFSRLPLQHEILTFLAHLGRTSLKAARFFGAVCGIPAKFQKFKNSDEPMVLSQVAASPERYHLFGSASDVIRVSRRSLASYQHATNIFLLSRWPCRFRVIKVQKMKKNCNRFLATKFWHAKIFIGTRRRPAGPYSNKDRPSCKCAIASLSHRVVS